MILALIVIPRLIFYLPAIVRLICRSSTRAVIWNEYVSLRDRLADPLWRDNAMEWVDLFAAIFATSREDVLGFIDDNPDMR